MIKNKKKDIKLLSRRASIVATTFAVSVIMAIAVSSAISDAFALGRNKSAEVTIKINEIDQLAGALEDNDVIEYPLLFSIYVNLRELGGKLDVKNPTATVSSEMDYGNLISAFTSPPPVRTVTLSIPEGATTDEIISIFVQNGIGTREGFINTINNYPFEYDFIAKLNEKVSENRIYRLDGYLYPDTYEFYTGRTEAYYIYKLLDRFCSVVAEIGAETLDDDAVIIASMIEASSSNVSQYEYVSSAIHNRLDDKETYPNLNCPATSAYAMGMSGIFIGVPSDEIKTLSSPYNTFTNKGLPPGAICNPGKNALIASLYPAESSYKYYLTLQNGSVVLSRTEWEYNKSCEALSPHGSILS